MAPFLRYGLQDIGDGRLSGQRLYDFRESKSFDGVLSSLVGRHTDKITVEFMGPSTDPKLQQQALSRMLCTKQIFHALVNRMSAYQMQVYGNFDIILRPFSHAVPSPVTPYTRRFLGSAWCLCLSLADWCLQSDVMTNFRKFTSSG